MDIPVSHRNCHNCGGAYSYHECNNIILFCPLCRHGDYVRCDIELPSADPCRIYVGEEQVAVMTSGSGNSFRLFSERYGIDEELASSGFAAALEAGRIVSEKMEG